tara:strand:+ start:409 stop:741 length:333 start_codon:yes stop_codon:yes gene_type:complete
MSIKQYKDIASMQNPGKQRTGKAGGGRVGATEGGRDWKLLKKAGTKAIEAAKDIDTYGNIASRVGVPGASAIIDLGKAWKKSREESGKPPIGTKMKKKKAARKARRKAGK